MKIETDWYYDGQVVQISLNDGKGNILDHIMMSELQKLLNSFSQNKDLKLIIFEGKGNNFSYGASVEEHKNEMAAKMLSQFHQLFYTLRDLSIPTAAKISGNCLGGGLELALMCNLIFADKSSKFGQPEIQLGVFPPPASIILPEKIGLAQAEKLLITGKTISAQEAMNIGLLTELYEDKITMESEVNHWIEKYILPKSASSLHFAVKASRIKFNSVISNFLPELEKLYVNQLMKTKDANEGINSFLEKRKPVWNNK